MLWVGGGLCHTIRYIDRPVASSASKCDIPECTRRPKAQCAVHTHCLDPRHTSGRKDDIVCGPPLLRELRHLRTVWFL